MLKTFDMKMKSITEAKKEFSKIVKETNETGEPTFIFNHNKPEAVILSNEVYEKLVNSYKELEEKLFYTQVQGRIIGGPGKLIPAEQVLETEREKNPFVTMSDKELFD